MKSTSRRQLLRFLATSPFAALMPAQMIFAEEEVPDSSLEQFSPLISRPDDAINVFDFRRVAEHVLPPAHYGYKAGGADDGETMRANRAAFGEVFLRPHRLVDGTNVNTSLELFG